MPHPSHALQQASGFPPDDWRLLIRLPAAVMIATIRVREAPDDGGGPRAEGDAQGHQARNHPPRRTVAEGLAGLDAIAAGRSSDSALVRSVVAAIYAEPEDELVELPGGPDPFAEPVFGHCRRAADLLKHRVDPADAEAYLAWVRQIAVRVCGAAHSGGVLGLGDDRIGAQQQQFLDDLGVALS